MYKFYAIKIVKHITHLYHTQRKDTIYKTPDNNYIHTIEKYRNLSKINTYETFNELKKALWHQDAPKKLMQKLEMETSKTIYLTPNIEPETKKYDEIINNYDNIQNETTTE